MFALILDDSELNNLLMQEAIRGVGGCTPQVFTRPTPALDFLRAHADEIGIFTCDYDMPEMDGIQVIRAARATPGFTHVPILMVTSSDQRRVRREALEAGATDFVTKPFDASEIKARVANLVALNQARRAEQDRAAWLAREVASAVSVIEQREVEIVQRLARAAEHRDGDTGDHVARVSGYVALIAANLGLPAERVRHLALASTMHDVGKVGVPDSILLKPGPLDPEERRRIESHAWNGHIILEGSQSELVRLAAEIALTHHERWDGQGYPQGLAGERIPLSGRIVSVADVLDALTSHRPYKRAWSADETRLYLQAHAGTQFDPACVEALMRGWPEVVERLAGRAAA